MLRLDDLASGYAAATDTDNLPSAARSTRSERAAVRMSSPGSAPGPPPSNLIPVSRPRPNPAMVAMRLRSATSSTDTSMASSVPTVSIATSTPSGASDRGHDRPDLRRTRLVLSAESARTTSWRAGLAVPITRAPAEHRELHCHLTDSADAPWTNTVSPSSDAVAVSRWTAVTPVSEQIRPPPRSVIVDGFGSAAAASTTTRSA